MKLSQAGLDLIKHFEGCKLETYLDCVGVPTIGYGHTGKDVCGGETWTQHEADECLAFDTSKFATGVALLLKRPATQGQFDAMVSFAYNLGLHALATSTLLKLFNDGDVAGAAEEFHKWCHAGGEVVAGLMARRAAEKEIFLS
jgi:lysozyme